MNNSVKINIKTNKNIQKYIYENKQFNWELLFLHFNDESNIY